MQLLWSVSKDYFIRFFLVTLSVVFLTLSFCLGIYIYFTPAAMFCVKTTFLFLFPGMASSPSLFFRNDFLMPMKFLCLHFPPQLNLRKFVHLVFIKQITSMRKCLLLLCSCSFLCSFPDVHITPVLWALTYPQFSITGNHMTPWVCK